MKNSAELLKAFANRLATFALTSDGREALNLLQLAGLPLPSGNSPESSSNITSFRYAESMASPEERPHRVGNWEWKTESNAFVRCRDMADEWNLWAQVPKIEAKTRKRVVLIGESVARGYLYDPQFTPAKALQNILKSQLGENEIEVVDLARTNLKFEISKLAASALRLQPNAVVIFAGNNWTVSGTRTDLSPDVFPYLNAVLRERGVPGLKEFCEEALTKKAKELVNEISRLYESQNIPLVWVIPEFNLGEWRDPIPNAPCLGENANLEWISYRVAAHSALENRDFCLAGVLAKKMTELDGGLAADGFYILAECCQHIGDLKGARYALESARDALVWDTSFYKTPRIHSIVQDIIRREAIKFNNIQVVDLPRLFDEHLGGALPDRRLFLDYCHLNSDGIKLAMAATASCLLKHFTSIEAPWPSLMCKSTAPTSRVEAEAAFLAAIHNAHWHQRPELIDYYCRKALAREPAISEVMVAFADIQMQPIPMLICKSAAKLAMIPWPSIQFYLFNVPHQQLDKVLLSAIENALDRAGTHPGRRFEQARVENLAEKECNLLDFYYCSSSMQPQELSWVVPDAPAKEHDYYKAYWFKSIFFFVWKKERSALVSLTCRLPEQRREIGTIVVQVNDFSSCKIDITKSWSTWQGFIPQQAMRDGVNEIVVWWPIPDYCSSDLLNAAADTVIQGRHELYCLFGEVHCFTVRAEQLA